MSTEQETSEVKENGRKSKNLIIITGPTASGKDTVIDLFIERHPNFKRIVPYTTRTPHINEQDGVDYHFVSLEWFKQNQDRFCAITQRMISNQTIYYGTALSDLQMILKGEQRIWKLDPYTACNLDSCLGESLSSDEIKTLLSQTAIIYLGVDRLTVLKDRLKKKLILLFAISRLFRQRNFCMA